MKLEDLFEGIMDFNMNHDVVRRHAPAYYKLDDNHDEPKTWGIFVGNRMIGPARTKQEAATALKNPMLLKTHGRKLEARKIN